MSLVFLCEWMIHRHLKVAWYVYIRIYIYICDIHDIECKFSMQWSMLKQCLDSTSNCLQSNIAFLYNNNIIWVLVDTLHIYICLHMYLLIIIYIYVDIYTPEKDQGSYVLKPEQGWFSSFSKAIGREFQPETSFHIWVNQGISGKKHIPRSNFSVVFVYIFNDSRLD